MNRRKEGYFNSTTRDLNRSALIMTLISITSLLLAYGLIFIEKAKRVVTPDQHEVAAMVVFIYLPLHVLSIIFSVLAIKNVILIRSIRGKQSLLTMMLLIMIVSFWVYKLAI